MFAEGLLITKRPGAGGFRGPAFSSAAWPRQKKVRACWAGAVGRARLNAVFYRYLAACGLVPRPLIGKVHESLGLALFYSAEAPCNHKLLANESGVQQEGVKRPRKITKITKNTREMRRATSMPRIPNARDITENNHSQLFTATCACFKVRERFVAHEGVVHSPAPPKPTSPPPSRCPQGPQATPRAAPAVPHSAFLISWWVGGQPAAGGAGPWFYNFKYSLYHIKPSTRPRFVPSPDFFSFSRLDYYPPRPLTYPSW